MSTPIGIAHLTLLALTPPELVTDRRRGRLRLRRRPRQGRDRRRAPVPDGARVADVPRDRAPPRRHRPDGARRRVPPVGPDTGPDDWLPALEAGAALGARTFSVVGVDPDRGRLTDTLARLAADAAALRHPPDPGADQLPAGQPGRRRRRDRPRSRVPPCCSTPCTSSAAAATLDDVRALEPDLVPVVQLCDGPLVAARDPRAARRAAAGHDRRRVGAARSRPVSQRQVVGEGEFPLAELLAAVPAATPMSVEVPHATLQARLSPGRVRRPQPARRPRAARTGGRAMSGAAGRRGPARARYRRRRAAAAVTGADEGLSTLVLEKTEFLGGTTAYSAGTCWIPGNRFQRADGTGDADGREPLPRRAGRRPRPARAARGLPRPRHRDARLPRPDRVRFLPPAQVVDYHPEVPGAATGGARWSRRRSTAAPSAGSTSAACGVRCPSSRCSAAR